MTGIFKNERQAYAVRQKAGLVVNARFCSINAYNLVLEFAHRNPVFRPLADQEADSLAIGRSLWMFFFTLTCGDPMDFSACQVIYSNLELTAQVAAEGNLLAVG